ncbi:MAG TPA: hypothetical protein PKE04_07325, partial [Clostridia bacterium]|nr:hypothetical protein [Clostridia bacterium]
MAIVQPTPFYGDARPCCMYRNGIRLAGYRWHEQTGPDMALEGTYNDRVSILAQGRGYQEKTAQGKNLFDSNLDTLPWARTSIRSSATQIMDGIRLIRTSGTGSGSSGYDFVMPPFFLGKTVAVSAIVGLPSGGLGIVSFRIILAQGSSVTTTLASATGTGQRAMTVTIPESYPTGSDNLRLRFYADVGSASNIGDYVDFTNIQIELGTATAYEPFTPDSPSHSYPSPVRMAAGDLRAQCADGTWQTTLELP